MKKTAKILTAALSLIMLLGAVAVSADTVDDVTPVTETAQLVQVYLTVEGPDGLYAFADGMFNSDGSVTAGDVVTALLDEKYPDMEVTGISDGYISSINGIASGTFGGWDGWLYIVKYSLLDENGELDYHTDIPSVGINDYEIVTASQIILYYGNYDDALAGYYTTEDNKVKLVSYTPVYDDNYNVVSFEESPLAGGSFVFTPVTVDKTTGEETLGEPISFVADENGLTELDGDFKAVPNGVYYGSIGKQSDETATVGEETITKPEVSRYSFIYTVDNHPTPEELRMEQVFFLLTGIKGQYYN